MADVFHTFPIRAAASRVFDVMTSPGGLAQWWALSATGEATVSAEYGLDFGPEYQWSARVRSCARDVSFEWELIDAMDDWRGTVVGFVLRPDGDRTWVDFYHTGWPAVTEHYKVSNCCWAAYLRVLRRYIEHGEVVPYEDRLDV